MTTYSLATSVLGPLEIHEDGCSHLGRLHRDGGGVLADGLSYEAAAAQAASEVSTPAKIAPCVRRRKIAPLSHDWAATDSQGYAMECTNCGLPWSAYDESPPSDGPCRGILDPEDV